MTETAPQDMETQTTERVGDPMPEMNERVRAAREMIPVSATGVTPVNFAQQIDYAQTMAKARAAIPSHLAGNVGDCLAVIDISTRAGLSPYMVANKTYVQNGRLCFESQLFHAFAQASGLLSGDLEVTYEGDAGDKVCVVTGYLRSDPHKPRVHRSPALKDRHPGYVLMRGNEKRYLTYAEGEKMKAIGELTGIDKMRCQGSPLWGTKPDVQMFYDTSRDWIRIYAPRATLGIYTPDEMDEFGGMKDVTPAGPGLGDRLSGADIQRHEGHRPGYATTELDQIAPNAPGARVVTVEAERPLEPPEGYAGAVTVECPQCGAKPGEPCVTGDKVRSDFHARRDAAWKKTQEETTETASQAPAGSRPQNEDASGTAAGGANESEASDAPAPNWPEGKTPRNPDEYLTYARDWIFRELDADAIEQRWAQERKLRNGCGVTSEDREPLEADKNARVAELRGKGS